MAAVPNERLTFAVGDVHGRFDLVQRAIESIEHYAAGRPSRTIMLGDYVDRGPDSRSVVEFLMAASAARGASLICLKGNHEQLMLRACREGGPLSDYWRAMGGDATLQSYPDGVLPEHLEWLDQLPLTAHDEHRCFVHAGVMPGRELRDNGEETFLWIRGPFLRADAQDLPCHIVHGHSPHHELKPVVSRPELLAHRTNLDSGAFATGVLTVGVFDGDRAGGPIAIIQVTAGDAQVSLLDHPEDDRPGVEAAQESPTAQRQGETARSLANKRLMERDVAGQAFAAARLRFEANRAPQAHEGLLISEPASKPPSI